MPKTICKDIRSVYQGGKAFKHFYISNSDLRFGFRPIGDYIIEIDSNEDQEDFVKSKNSRTISKKLKFYERGKLVELESLSYSVGIMRNMSDLDIELSWEYK